MEANVTVEENKKQKWLDDKIAMYAEQREQEKVREDERRKKKADDEKFYLRKVLTDQIIERNALKNLDKYRNVEINQFVENKTKMEMARELEHAQELERKRKEVQADILNQINEKSA